MCIDFVAVANVVVFFLLLVLLLLLQLEALLMRLMTIFLMILYYRAREYKQLVIMMCFVLKCRKLLEPFVRHTGSQDSFKLKRETTPQIDFHSHRHHSDQTINVAILAAILREHLTVVHSSTDTVPDDDYNDADDYDSDVTHITCAGGRIKKKIKIKQKPEEGFVFILLLLLFLFIFFRDAGVVMYKLILLLLLFY